MEGVALVFTSLWLGILTALCPCPLATNLAALAYLSKEGKGSRRTVLAGMLYTIGRCLTYSAISLALALSLLSAPVVSDWLQRWMNKLLGPLLILVGMVLLDLLHFHMHSSPWLKRAEKRASQFGLFGSFLMGVTFAASFCPISAAVFFGSLIPLSLKHHSPLLLPSAFGIGSALPILAVAILITAGLTKVGETFDKLKKIEPHARTITGIIFIAVGMYYCWVYVF